MDNIAFLNAVERNGGVITPEMRARYGVDAPVPQAPVKGAEVYDPRTDETYPQPVDIPEGWQNLKPWTRIAKIAREIDPDATVKSLDDAKAIIEAELAKREAD